MPKSPSPRCPRCSAPMSRMYLRVADPDTGKRSFVGVAWLCGDPSCNHIMRD